MQYSQSSWSSIWTLLVRNHVGNVEKKKKMDRVERVPNFIILTEVSFYQVSSLSRWKAHRIFLSQVSQTHMPSGQADNITSEPSWVECMWLRQSVFHFSLLIETWEQQISHIPLNSYKKKNGASMKIKSHTCSIQVIGRSRDFGIWIVPVTSKVDGLYLTSVNFCGGKAYAKGAGLTGAKGRLKKGYTEVEVALTLRWI